MTTSGVLHDIYDGNVWKEFLSVNGKSFLSLPYNFGFIINVDWFQPFKRSSYSLGVIYSAILNLPRHECFLPHNVMVVGIIPGPHEPSLTINSFLRPLVDELKLLWNGVIIESNGRQQFVRAALLCVACDIPAGRKVSGFVGHRAIHACTKCLKSFPTDHFGSYNDYSGFNRDNWQIRDNTSHRLHAVEHQSAKTKSDQTAIEKQWLPLQFAA